MSHIPIIILSGFLGSGKTTLLLRLLQESGHRDLLKFLKVMFHITC